MDNKVTKKRVFDILQIGNREDFASRAFDIIIAISIVLNITSLVMSTFDEFEPYYDILSGIEAITICIFCVEYALRIWTAEYLYPDLDRRKAVLRFFVSFDGIIDLLTISKSDVHIVSLSANIPFVLQHGELHTCPEIVG